ncbi:PREDICTED: cytochrome P450 2F5-like, partial [Gekko japonicus]|uniref:Cytochrome P450 2F5-like n=1 Tax=Gekko japonicus TaxID=146911 RepID=A0ABM1L5S3_GEKJA
LRERYGSVYTVYLGSKPFVVLCGYQAVKEALVDQGEDFSGRGDFPMITQFTQGDGIVFSHGGKWKALRRFAIQTLRGFGMGRHRIEERIQEEAGCMVEEFAKTKAEPVDPTSLIGRAIFNITCSIIFGDRFDYEDKKFLTLVDLMNDNFHHLSSSWVQLYNVFSRVMYYLPGPHNRLKENFEKLRLFVLEMVKTHQETLDPNSPRDFIDCFLLKMQQLYNVFSRVMYYLPGPHNRLKENFEKLRLFVLEMVKTHQETLDPNSPRDFIDCFLLKMQQEKEDPLSYFHTNTLVMTTHNLFFAGTETTNTTLLYGILILMKYPEVQGESFEVHVHEMFPNKADKDGPHGTRIMPLIYSVHRDVTQFKDPEVFDPTNFLDKEGSFHRNDAFMPFGTGKRVCLGEPLARTEIFLFLTTLVQHFAFRPVVPPEEIDLSPMAISLVSVPHPFKFRAVPR